MYEPKHSAIGESRKYCHRKSNYVIRFVSTNIHSTTTTAKYDLWVREEIIFDQLIKIKSDIFGNLMMQLRAFMTTIGRVDLIDSIMGHATMSLPFNNFLCR